MAKKDKEMLQYRNDGMAYALKVAKEKGIEALEKEVQYRKATFLPSAVQEKDVNKFVEEVKMNCLDTVLIMSLMVLRDEFDFEQADLERFKKRFNFKSECLAEDYTTWKDLQEILQEETNIKTTIRNANMIDGAAVEEIGKLKGIGPKRKEAIRETIERM